MGRFATPKKRASMAIDAFAEAHDRDVLVEMPDHREPPWWAGRDERLYRETVIPRLESLSRLTPVQRRVLDKARAFLKAAEEDHR